MSHDPSDVLLLRWFGAQETFIITINVENSCAALYFCIDFFDFFIVIVYLMDPKQINKLK